MYSKVDRIDRRLGTVRVGQPLGTRWTDEGDPLNDRTERFERVVGQLRSLMNETSQAEVERTRAIADAASMLSPGQLSELVHGARRVRNRHFGRKLFGEPAWDILLELHIAHYRDEAVSVSAAVTFGETPQTTGLRWLTMLESEGLIERRDDPTDHRRTFVSLTPKAISQMDKFAVAFGKWAATKAMVRKL